MTFLKNLGKLFTGGPRQPAPGEDIGLYFYVKSSLSGDIQKVRINPNNDLSFDEEENNYHVIKVVVGKPSYHRMSLELSFDKNRRLTDSKVSGGILVDEAEYKQYKASAEGQS
jgi:hypothetical protein